MVGPGEPKILCHPANPGRLSLTWLPLYPTMLSKMKLLILYMYKEGSIKERKSINKIWISIQFEGTSTSKFSSKKVNFFAFNTVRPRMYILYTYKKRNKQFSN